MTKYILVSGGVISGIGKGVIGLWSEKIGISDFIIGLQLLPLVFS